MHTQGLDLLVLWALLRQGYVHRNGNDMVPAQIERQIQQVSVSFIQQNTFETDFFQGKQHSR
jgi:hypothetical protein